MKKRTKISIIGGAGHIGLPLAVKLAEKNFLVNIIDKNMNNLVEIKKKKPPFKEKDLKKRLSKVLDQNRLIFSNKLKTINNSKFVIICVGTPISKKLIPELKSFFSLIKDIKKYIKQDSNIIIRSSVLPGTCEKIYKLIKSNCRNLSYCPERIIEGFSLEELPVIPQIVSASNKATLSENKRLFKKITNHVIVCNFREAELSKIFSNMYRYINFAIPNEMHLMSKKLNVDFNRVRKIMKFNYPRNKGLAKAGLVGGPCLMKDSMQMSYLFKKKSSLVNAAYQTNEKLPEMIVNDLKTKNKNKKIGILGLTFKPNSDDVRGSLSLKLLKVLKRKGFKCLYSDPYYKLSKGISTKKLIEKSDVVIIATNHGCYKNLKIKRNKTIIDLSGHLK